MTLLIVQETEVSWERVLYDEDRRPKIDALRQQFPELFVEYKPKK